YRIDAASGALLPGATVAAGSEPMAVTVHPSGRFLYTASIESNDISAYTIDSATGALAPVPGSPFPGGDPYALGVDASGRFLYVTNYNLNSVSGYAIDPLTGSLTPVPGSPFTAGLN